MSLVTLWLKHRYISLETSVGSNPKITNFELLRTLEVELRTLSNPGLPTKTELQTHPNPPKIPNSEPTNWVRPNTKMYLKFFFENELLRCLECNLLGRYSQLF